MKRVKLTHGSARVEDNVSGETLKALDELSKKAYNMDTIKSCVDCVYSNNGETSCFRHMSYAKPKIDYSKGTECAHNNYVHYLKYEKK